MEELHLCNAVAHNLKRDCYLILVVRVLLRVVGVHECILIEDSSASTVTHQNQPRTHQIISTKSSGFTQFRRPTMLLADCPSDGDRDDSESIAWSKSGQETEVASGQEWVQGSLLSLRECAIVEETLDEGRVYRLKTPAHAWKASSLSAPPAMSRASKQ